jgi:hypothetical protein
VKKGSMYAGCLQPKVHDIGTPECQNEDSLSRGICGDNVFTSQNHRQALCVDYEPGTP